MPNKVHYLSLLMTLIIFTGCETVHDTGCGAASGFSKDVHNASDPNKNGWNTLAKANAWMEENMW